MKRTSYLVLFVLAATAAFASVPRGRTALAKGTVAFSYDRLDRLTSMSDEVGSTAFTYHNFGAFSSGLATEDGPWASDTVTHVYAPSTGLRDHLTLTQPAGSWTQWFTYDSQLRLQSVRTADGFFNYSYGGSGGLIKTLALPGGSLVTNAFDPSGRLAATALVDRFGHIGGVRP